MEAKKDFSDVTPEGLDKNIHLNLKTRILLLSSKLSWVQRDAPTKLPGWGL